MQQPSGALKGPYEEYNKELATSARVWRGSERPSTLTPRVPKVFSSSRVSECDALKEIRVCARRLLAVSLSLRQHLPCQSDQTNGRVVDGKRIELAGAAGCRMTMTRPKMFKGSTCKKLLVSGLYDPQRLATPSQVRGEPRQVTTNKKACGRTPR